MTKWFIQNQDKITGPYNPEEIKKAIESQTIDLNSAFVWSRGFTDWIPASQWSVEVTKKHGQNLQNQKVNVQKPPHTPPIAPTLTSKEMTPQNLIENIKTHVIEKFKVRYNDIDQKDMTQDELMHFASQKEDPSKITILDRKAKEWKEIYTLPDIANKLGISRRKHQRVPILAHFTGLNTTNSNKLNIRVVSVSQGGFGLTDNFDLKLGESVQGQISSPHFYTPITVEADVTYSGLDGYVGLKFTQINDEGVALITDYVKRFGKAPGQY